MNMSQVSSCGEHTENAQPMIRLEGISKVFEAANGNVEALTDVSLDIMPGDIQGIIGFSGAGKSTLVRCINLLERPNAGKVYVEGRELTAMNEHELRTSRKKIGMIFQLFNLMRSRTVFSNVAFPLKGSGLSKTEKAEKVMNLLKIVGLEQKAYAYPSELSGGQKQRVAIARALANDPKVLLCDEATSALDPQTTRDILDLLKELNRNLGITIVIITHEMAVVKEVCNRVAVMENGRIVEKGDIYSVFSNPKAPITRRFIDTTDGIDSIKSELAENPKSFGLKHGDTVVSFAFHGESTGNALVSQLSREFDIDISIIYGNVEMIDAKPLGKLVTVIRGDKQNVEYALRKIEGSEVRSEVLYHV